MSNREVIETFYQSFQRGDWKSMQACYHDHIEFSDPAFPNLKGSHAKAMWHMLASSAKDLVVTYSQVNANETTGSCEWEAKYSFSRTGARVHNRIHATFEFRDGKIIRHSDKFDLTRWAGMALGMPGKLLGWTPWMQNKIRATAAASLAKFLAAHPEYTSPSSSAK
ncbi:MAG: nuclear transport factor 2 family protein [Cyclobacteriaceae bacterium]|nr:nuclear transport factor 2 family protein [Cyclobacteriaceae bacterium]